MAGHQTDLESQEFRRELRAKERELHSEIQNKENELAKLGGTVFRETTGQLNSLYSNIRKAREANLDANNLDECSKVISKQAQALTHTDLSRFDILSFVKALRETFINESGQDVDWLAFGDAVNGAYQLPPSTNFIYGSLDTTVVQRVRKRRAADDEETKQFVEETQPDDYKDYAANRSDAQARRIQVLKEAIQSHDGPIGFYELTLNPDSFSQTVENIFDVAFLLKDMVIKLEINRETGLPQVSKVVDALGRDSVDTQVATKQQQCIATITPAEWKEFVELLDIETSFIPTRPRARH